MTYAKRYAIALGIILTAIYGMFSMLFTPPGGGAFPYFLSNVLIAAMLAHWYLHAQASELRPFTTWLCLILIAGNPLIVYAATGRFGNALTTVAYYVLGWSVYRLRAKTDVRTGVAAALAFVLFAVSNVHAVYVVAILIPLALLLIETRILKESPLGAYMLLFFPLAILILSFSYIHWLFGGNFLAGPFILPQTLHATTRTPFRMVWMGPHITPTSPPLLLALGATLLLFPAAFWCAAALRRRQLLFWPHVVMTVAPLIALVFSELTISRDPVPFLLYLVAPTLVGGLYTFRRREQRYMYVLLLLVGAAAATWMFAWLPLTPHKPTYLL